MLFSCILLCALIIRYGGHKKMRRDLIHFASTYGQMQMQTMKELSVPFAVLSEEGQLLWGNDEFVRVAVNKKQPDAILPMYFRRFRRIVFRWTAAGK